MLDLISVITIGSDGESDLCLYFMLSRKQITSSLPLPEPSISLFWVFETHTQVFGFELINFVTQIHENQDVFQNRHLGEHVKINHTELLGFDQKALRGPILPC